MICSCGLAGPLLAEVEEGAGEAMCAGGLIVMLRL